MEMEGNSMIEVSKTESPNYKISETGEVSVVAPHLDTDDKVFVKLSGELTHKAKVALDRLSGALSRDVIGQ